MGTRRPHVRPLVPDDVHEESLARAALGLAAVVAWFLILVVILPVLAA